MSLRSRLAGLSIAAVGLAAVLLGPGTKPALALTGPCVWNEAKQDWDYPDPSTGHSCSNDSYSLGTQEGYVATRGAILEGGKPVWAEYEPDQYIGGQFAPGVPTRIAVADGVYENAQVLGREEVAFAVERYNQLHTAYYGKFDLVPRAQFPPKPYKDNQNHDLPPPRGLNPRTLFVMLLRQPYVEPNTDPVLAELPLNPEGLSDVSHTNYLIQTQPGSGLGSVLYHTGGQLVTDTSGHLQEGTISYLSAFFSEVSNDAQVRWGFCKDYNSGNYATGQIGNTLTRDDVFAFADCDAHRIGNIWAPLAGAWVDSASSRMLGGGIPTQANGGYTLSYLYLAGYSYWDTMFVTLNYQPLDVRSILGSRWYIQKKVQAGAQMELDVGKLSAYASQVGGLGISFGTSAANVRYTGGNDNPLMGAVNDGVSTDTHKPRSVNFPVEVAYMNGWIQYVNPPRPGIALNAEPLVSIAGDDGSGELSSAPPQYSKAAVSPLRKQVPIDLATGKEATGGTGGGPTIDRVIVPEKELKPEQAPAGLAPDGSPNPVYDDALLLGLSRTDFANTDVHVFGPGGDLVTSRIGLRQNESPGLTCDIGKLSPSGTPLCTVTESNPAAFTPIADFIRNRYPGARYKVVIVNRSTGYVGTGYVSVGGDGLNGLQAYEIEGNAGPHSPIFMRPPNLKVEVKRAPRGVLGNDVCRSVAADQPCEQIVGFEGAGLTDDQYIIISTEWLDWDGSPLPSSLPGFTGRLSRVTEGGKLITADPGAALTDPDGAQASGTGADKRAGDLSHFQIRPNRRTQVVRLGGDANAYHYYLHVSGANGERCGKATSEQSPSHETWEWFTENSPACASFAQQVDAQFNQNTDSRPARFVPIKVPVFDSVRTTDLLRAQIEAARQLAASNPSQAARIPKVDPVYTYVYRPEAQFSIYDLKELTSPELVTKYDPSKKGGKTSLSFGYDLGTVDHDAELPTYGSAKNPTWSLGFAELVALVNDENSKATWADLETLLLLSPAEQLNEVQAAAGMLTPQDYLALQLYLANDRGNPLYVDYDVPFPLISMDVSPIALKRRQNLSHFGNDVQAPPPFQDEFQPLRFELMKPACLTVKATPRGVPYGDMSAVVLLNKVPHKVAGAYYYVVDGGELVDKGLPANSTLHFIAETCDEAPIAGDQGSDGKSQIKTHRLEIDVSRETVRSARGLGEIVEHDVNVLDGSLHLSRKDFALKGRGPVLALARDYTNLGKDDSTSVLGPGWSHSFDLKLVPTSTEESGNRSVPDWVEALRGATSKCDPGNCPVESHTHPSGALQLTGVVVNGVSFRWNGAWQPESGHHVRLVQHCSPQAPSAECFEFISKDKTHYYYDYPVAMAPTVAVKDPSPTMLGLSDGLLERLGIYDLRVRPSAATGGQPGTGLRPSLVRRIVDRFHYQLKIDADASGRVLAVTEGDELGSPAQGRSCRFLYAPDVAAGCDTDAEAFDRLRGITCLDGATSAVSGDLTLHVDYCYDAVGNLASVKQGRHEERYEYEHEGGASPDAANEAGNFNLVAAVEINDLNVEQRTSYTYRKDVAPHTYLSDATPEPVDLFDMMDSVTYPATEPMPGQDAVATIKFGYGDEGNVGHGTLKRTVSDPRGPPYQGTQYTLNGLGNPLEIVEGGLKTTTMQWSYDVGSSPCGETAPGDNQMVYRRIVVNDRQESATSTFAYDADGNLTEECTDVSGHTLRNHQEWDAFGQLQLRRDFRGVQESWHYRSSDGFLESYTNGAGVLTQYAESTELRGRTGTESVSGDAPRVVEYHYDQLGNSISTEITSAPGSEGNTKTRSSYDARSRLERQWDELNRLTTFEYDENDNLRFTYLPELTADVGQALVTTLESRYDAVGNKVRENDRNGVVLTYQYTGRNQIKTVRRTPSSNPQGDQRDYRYDLRGNLREETDFRGEKTQYEYDELGFRIKTIDRDGKVTTTLRDYVGNVVSTTDAGEPPLSMEVRYDALNREVYRKPICSDPDCGAIVTEYPIAPEVQGVGGAQVVYSVKVTAPSSVPGNSVTTRSGYDGRGLLVVKRDFRAKPFYSNYDSQGRLIRTEDEEGIVTTMAYNARGSLVLKEVHPRSGNGRALKTELVPDPVGNVLFTKRWRDATRYFEAGATFDAWNRAVTRHAPGSKTEHVSYDGEGNVVQHIDAAGRVRSWKRNVRGEIINFYDAEVKNRTPGQTATPNDKDYSLFYEETDANGNPRRVVNALGVVTTYDYNHEGRVKQITEAVGTADERTREFRDIDGLGNPHVVTDWRGNPTVLTYTSRHNLSTSTDPLGRVTTYRYDGQGNVASVVDPRPDTVRYFSRDDLGRVTDVHFPDTATLESHVKYDDVGNVVLSVNRRNSATHYELDGFLRVQFVKKSLGEQGALTLLQSNEYDDCGNLVGVTDANGHRTKIELNDRGLLWKTILPAVEGEAETDRTEERHYYDSGALMDTTPPHDGNESPYTIGYTYDREDRLISATVADETTSYAYDLLGNKHKETQPEGQAGGRFAGKSRQFDYDKLNRLSSTLDEVGLKTRYGYDKAGNLREVEGPFLDGQPSTGTPHTGYDYNPLIDRLEAHLQYRSGLGALVTKYEDFDEHDNVKRLKDANGREFHYTYDAYDRRTQASYPSKATAFNEPQQIDWDFDDQANSVKITETKKAPGGSELKDVTLEQYDLVFDRLQSRTQRGRAVSYEYDFNGNRTKVTSPLASTVYSFDARNRLATAVIAGSTTVYHYHQDDRIRQIDRGNGTTTSLTYDPRTLRLNRIAHAFQGGEGSAVAYTYDHNGNPTSMGDTRNGWPDVTTFDEYDPANRLVQFTQGGKVTRYEYERYNRHTENVKQNGVSQVNKTFHYDDLERLNDVVDDANAPFTVGYSYDNNGNTLSRVDSNAPANRTDFEYDSRDQLVRVTRGPPNTQQTLGRYDYDADGKRTRHVDGERGDVDYLYDDDAIIEETIGAGAAARTTRYHYGQELLAVAENAGVRYYHQDALGSTTQLSDDAGLAAVDYKYDPFGNVRNEAGDPTDNRQTYTGQEYDERTGLYYYGARYYDPVIGRFLTQDSVLGDVGAPASLHRYLYAYSNPLRYTDPTGHIAILKQGVEMFETTDKFLSEDAKKTTGVGDLALNIGSRFALKLFGSALGAANFVANSVVYATPLAMTSLGEDARAEFHESYEGAKTTIAAVQELHAKGELGATVATAAKEGGAKVVAALSGDRQAISDVVSGTAAFAAEFYLTGGASGVKSGVKLAVRSAELVAEGARVTLRVGAEAALTVVKTAARLTLESGSGRRLVAEGFAIAKSAASRTFVRGAETVASAARGLRQMSKAGELGAAFARGAARAGAEYEEITRAAAPVQIPFGKTLSKVAGGIGEVLEEAKAVGRNLRGGASAAEGATATRLPRNGMWEGVPGESNFTPSRSSRLPHPDDLDVVDLAPGDSVPFRNGRPDFSRWAWDEFEVPGLTGQRAGPGVRDAARMELAVAERYGLVGRSGRPTAAAGRAYLDRLGLVPHHAGGPRIQLLPQGLHGRTGVRVGIPHAGGATDLRGGGL